MFNVCFSRPAWRNARRVRTVHRAASVRTQLTSGARHKRNACWTRYASFGPAQIQSTNPKTKENQSPSQSPPVAVHFMFDLILTKTFINTATTRMGIFPSTARLLCPPFIHSTPPVPTFHPRHASCAHLVGVWDVLGSIWWFGFCSQLCMDWAQFPVRSSIPLKRLSPVHSSIHTPLHSANVDQTLY